VTQLYDCFDFTFRLAYLDVESGSIVQVGRPTCRASGTDNRENEIAKVARRSGIKQVAAQVLLALLIQEMQFQVTAFCLVSLLDSLGTKVVVPADPNLY
jgi:hypothetical protein